MSKLVHKIQHREKRIKNFDEVSLGINKRTAIEEAQKYPQYSRQEMHPASALGIDIPGFIRFLREGNVNAALRKIYEHNVLPGVCSRVCPPFSRPEEVVKENSVSLNIDIRMLERFVADHGRTGLTPQKPTGPKVAVVGSGPAGLAAAARLAGTNFSVTIFESLPLPGGRLRQSVPSFRLPRRVLQKEIADIQKLGVEIKTGIFVGSSIFIEEIFNQGFEAILLTVGLGSTALGNIPGDRSAGVFNAEDILLQCNTYNSSQILQKLSIKVGKTVVVYGWNEQALDVARVLVRLGKSVKLVSSKTEEDWFDRREFQFAADEGVEFLPLSEVIEIFPADEKPLRMRCRQLDYADPDSTGQWKVLPVPDSDFELEADTIILSSGHRENSYIDKFFGSVKINDKGLIELDSQTGQTSLEKVFAAGEAVIGSKYVDEVMADGIRAAGQIKEFLNGDHDDSAQDG